MASAVNLRLAAVLLVGGVLWYGCSRGGEMTAAPPQPGVTADGSGTAVDIVVPAATRSSMPPPSGTTS